MSRLDKTLADYVAIALSPALIMLMVGSLMWFLVAVFYQGHYDGRIYWILLCFVSAIVLIARIGIEEGQERAALFAVPLALAVGLATMRFSSSMYFHWILLGVAWWAAHKLTWDCTLIDEEQDSSGQGLLQFVGFGKKPPDANEGNGETTSENNSEKKEKEEAAEPEGVTERVGRMRDEAHPKRKTKGKAHTPGVWIVYFSLAALPLFGLGQMLVPVADSATRLWTFQLLATYVAAGLGLLVTTSFLGLRRYLRQRGVQMPPQMAGVWIALGAAIIVALLAVCAILPRPAAEYEVARMPDFPLKFTTPERESNRHATGKEGADKNDPDSQSRTQGEQDGTKPEGGKSDKPEPGGDKGSKAEEGRGNKKSPDGKSQGSSEGEKQGESGPKQDSSKSGEQQPSDENGKSSGEKEQASDGQQPQKNDSGEGSDPKGESEPGEKDNESGEKPSAEDRGDENERSESSSKADESRDSSRQSQDPRQQAERREEEEQKEEEEDERSERSGSQSPSSQPQKPDSPPFQLPQVSLSGGLFGLLKFVVYVVLACVGAWWLWKNWPRVLAGFRLFLQELRDLWARLFGGQPKTAEDGAEEEKPRARSDRPFADYVDPFSAGLAARYAPDELVRYTFEATEAWARENGCQREPDQTPHEFAARLGGHVESLRPGAVVLAKLYCQAAYAPGSLAPAGLEPLADFWRRLGTSHQPAVQPPPVGTPGG